MLDVVEHDIYNYCVEKQKPQKKKKKKKQYA